MGIDSRMTNNEMQIFDIFPTTLYTNKIENHEKYKEEFYKLYDKYDYEQTSIRNGIEWFHTTSENIGNPTIHLEDSLSELFEQIISNVKVYVHDILEYKEIFDFIITKSWISRSRKPFEKIRWHTHSTSDISFSYYLNMPPNSHKLQFSGNDNHNGLLAGLNKSDVKDAVRNVNKHNASTFYMNPPEGSLVLFPSTLQHGTEYASDDFKGERLAIAGDIVLVFKEDGTNDYSMGYINPKYWKMYK